MCHLAHDLIEIFVHSFWSNFVFVIPHPKICHLVNFHVSVSLLHYILLDDKMKDVIITVSLLDNKMKDVIICE